MKGLPQFVLYNAQDHLLEINPSINEKLGSYEIKIKLVDSLEASRTYSLNIEVIKNQDYGKN